MTANLLSRLQGLTAPDREVDALIWLQLTPGATRKQWSYIHTATQRECHVDETRNADGRLTIVPELTASLDAAIALVERMLPGWFYRVGKTSLFPNGWAYISRTHPSHCDRGDEASCADGKAATPAIALCIALLRALEARDGTE